MLPGLSGRGGPGGDGIAVEEDLDGADVPGEVAGFGVCPGQGVREARRLITIPRISPIVASALVAAVGQAESFDRGRDLAVIGSAWFHQQFTTGGKPKPLGISKRGNKYLRRQLIRGRARRRCLMWPNATRRLRPIGRRASSTVPIATSRS